MAIFREKVYVPIKIEIINNENLTFEETCFLIFISSELYFKESIDIKKIEERFPNYRKLIENLKYLNYFDILEDGFLVKNI